MNELHSTELKVKLHCRFLRYLEICLINCILTTTKATWDKGKNNPDGEISRKWIQH